MKDNLILALMQFLESNSRNDLCNDLINVLTIENLKSQLKAKIAEQINVLRFSFRTTIIIQYFKL